jgi:endogenous inhibitor of DNA gyrase (YacG/DUF329 family)
MSTPSKGSCAECRKPMPPREDNQNFPFCSARCKQIDLGKWFNEEYTLTVNRDNTERALPEEFED